MTERSKLGLLTRVKTCPFSKNSDLGTPTTVSKTMVCKDVAVKNGVGSPSTPCLYGTASSPSIDPIRNPSLQQILQVGPIGMDLDPSLG